jgi:signal peptidase I
MRTVRVVLILMCLGLVLVTACRGGSGASEDIYDERVFEILGKQESADEGDWRAWAALFEEFLDQLDSLNPPDSIEDEHDRFVAAYRDVVQIIRENEGDSANLSREEQSMLAEAQELDEAWLDAFGQEYRVTHFEVQGAAMLPGLQNGDHLKVPTFDGEPIERGQIIVFEFHLVDPSQPSRHFIKRVIGLPGETIEVRDGSVFVDGVPLVEDYLLNTPTYTYGPRTVPADGYFVLGDNRRNSYDSHQWPSECGSSSQCEFVPHENIVGVLPAGAQPYARSED